MAFFNLLQRAGKLWWQHWIGILVLNVLWFLLLLPIVTAPPATAAFFAIGKCILDDEVWDARDMWEMLQQLFFPAWRWALPNLVLGGVLVGNFALYADQQGAIWEGVRIVWGGLLLLWLAINYLYWPFWLTQTDKRVTTTLMNGLRFCLQHPLLTFLFVVVSSVMLILGGVLVLPFVFGLVGWVVLAALAIVRWSVEERSVV